MAFALRNPPEPGLKKLRRTYQPLYRLAMQLFVSTALTRQWQTQNQQIIDTIMRKWLELHRTDTLDALTEEVDFALVNVRSYNYFYMLGDAMLVTVRIFQLKPFQKSNFLHVYQIVWNPA